MRYNALCTTKCLRPGERQCAQLHVVFPPADQQRVRVAHDDRLRAQPTEQAAGRRAKQTNKQARGFNGERRNVPARLTNKQTTDRANKQTTDRANKATSTCVGSAEPSATVSEVRYLRTGAIADRGCADRRATAHRTSRSICQVFVRCMRCAESRSTPSTVGDDLPAFDRAMNTRTRAHAHTDTHTHGIM